MRAFILVMASISMGVVVQARSAHTQALPALSVRVALVDDPPPDGDGDGSIEPGEGVRLRVRLLNSGTEPATGVMATLATTTGGITITQPEASYPDLDPTRTGTNRRRFTIRVSKSFPAGAGIALQLSLQTDQGPFTLPLRLRAGGRPTEFTYVTYGPAGGSLGQEVSAFARNPATGALSAVPGSPYPLTGTLPSDVLVHPSNRFLYVLNTQSANMSIFAIDRATGSLSPTAETGSFVGFDPHRMAIDPSGRFLYASDLDFELQGFRIDAATGALTPLTGSPFPGAFNGVGVAIAPSGRFLYLANIQNPVDNRGSIEVNAIDPATGALARVGEPVLAGDLTTEVAIDPSGRYLYATNRGTNDVSAFTIDPGAGTLTPVPGSPFPAGQAPRSMAMATSGRFLYVANRDSATLSVYAIAAGSGALSPIAGSPFATGPRPLDMAIDCTGAFLHVTNGEPVTAVTAFTLDAASGVPTLVPGSPFPAERAGAFAIATTTFACAPPR
jgi:6-phosphogluconolactonase (cycloisomerase 2 family)